MCVLRAREGWQGKTRRPCSQKGVHGNKVSRISIPPPFPPLHLLQTGRLVRIKLMVWSTYLLYGPSAAAAATAAAPLGSLLAYFLTGTECNTIRGWHFPRRYTHMHPLTLTHTHTHTYTRWMPSWPVRDQQASSSSSQQRDVRETSGRGFRNKIEIVFPQLSI